MSTFIADLKIDEITSIIIIGREWFDRVNGNSYHSSEVFINGSFLLRTDRQYGYGDSYIYTAMKGLQSLGYLKDLVKYENGISEVLWQYCNRKDIALNCRKIDGLKKSQL